MNLIKKTIILTNRGAEGYASVIRVGNDVGAKIVGANFVKGMRAGIKVGRNKTFFALLDGAKTEISLENVSFQQNDEIGCIVMQGDVIVAKGGTVVKSREVSEHFASLPPQSDAVAAISEEPSILSEPAPDDALNSEQNGNPQPNAAEPQPNETETDPTDGMQQNEAKTDPSDDTQQNGAETDPSVDPQQNGAETDPTVDTQQNAAETDPSDGTNRPASPEENGGDGGNGSADGSDDMRSLLDRLEIKDGADFYNGVREKVEELFVIYPAENKLAALIPNSEWVKINYDGEDYYVVGRITENGRTVLLGYGVPGKKSVTPPKIADEIASWLTVSGLDDGYDGYWLLFQDAVTGKVTPVE